MNRETFITSFSKRLNSSLQENGYSSSRAKAGIDISQLSAKAEVSYQMARKYVLGLALPDLHVIAKIGTWLNVSPSWLLFGETELHSREQKPISCVEIDCELLKYILNKCLIFFPPAPDADKIINYIVSVIYDASHIDTDSKTIVKIVDMMISSAIQFKSTENKIRA